MHIQLVIRRRCCCCGLYSRFHLVFTRFPWVTLGVSAIIVVSLNVGVIFMEITTDPVELWAGPHSRSRAEKDFFDDKFGPFYRTAQVFIKPVYKENVIFKTNLSQPQWNNWLISPFEHFTDQAWNSLWNFGKSLLPDSFVSYNCALNSPILHCKFSEFRNLVQYLTKHSSKLCSNYKDKSNNSVKMKWKLKIFVLHRCQRTNRKSPHWHNVLFSQFTGISKIQWKFFWTQPLRMDIPRTT